MQGKLFTSVKTQKNIFKSEQRVLIIENTRYFRHRYENPNFADAKSSSLDASLFINYVTS